MAGAAARKTEDEDLLTLPPEDDQADPEIVIDEGPATPEQQDEPRDDVASLREQLETMRRQSDEANARAESESRQRAESERRLLEAQRRSSEDQTGRLTAEEAAIASAIAAETAAADNAEAELSSAMERGDMGAAAKAQRKMAQAEARRETFRQREAELADARQRFEQRPTPQNDPLANYPPRTAEWIRANPDFLVTGSRFHNQAMAAHYEAVGQGLVPESTEYFDHINARVKPPSRKPEPAEDADMTATETTTPARKPAARQPAAPPSRGQPSQQQRPDDGRLRLTADEKMMALAAKDTLANHPGEQLTDAEAIRRYAENKAEIARQERGAA